jgi:hypothetical protein
MFLLEPAIAEWRQQMLAAGIASPVPLEELEAHLREEIERQMESGMEGQAAFRVAVERMGQSGLLKKEFKRAGTMGSLRRELAGYIYAGILAIYASVMTHAIIINHLSAGEKLLGLASLAALLIGSYVVWQIGPRLFPIISSRWVQSAVGLFGGVSGAIWMMVFVRSLLPRFDFTSEQLVVAMMWAMVPTLILPCLAFRMLDASENLPPGALFSQRSRRHV